MRQSILLFELVGRPLINLIPGESIEVVDWRSVLSNKWIQGIKRATFKPIHGRRISDFSEAPASAAHKIKISLYIRRLIIHKTVFSLCVHFIFSPHTRMQCRSFGLHCWKNQPKRTLAFQPQNIAPLLWFYVYTVWCTPNDM